MNEKEIVNTEVVKAEIQDAISQIDENLEIDDFSCEYDKSSRKLKIYATVKTENNEIIKISNELG